MAKTFITVIAEHSPKGEIKPLSIIWKDGRKYSVDKVLDVRWQLPLKWAVKAGAILAGYMAKRFIYTVILGNGL